MAKRPRYQTEGAANSFYKERVVLSIPVQPGSKIELRDHKGNLKVSPRKHDDHLDNPLWPTGSITSRIVCWSTFQKIWRRNYKKLVLPNARHDICGECFILANSFQYRKSGTSRAPNAADGDANVSSRWCQHR
jgi:hypothetical protein